MTKEGTYQPARSRKKAFRVAAPYAAGIVLAWGAKTFWEIDVPLDVALGALGLAAAGIEWARNRVKHGWKR